MKMVFALAATAIAAAFPLSGIAQAKGPISADFCGASICVAITDPGTLQMLPRTVFSNEAIALAPAPPQAYYSLRLTLGEGPRAPHLTVHSLPEARLLRTSTGWAPVEALWMALDADADSALRPLTASIEPFGAPRLTAAFVGARRVRSPSSYLSLYSVPSAGRPLIRGADWLTIRLRSATASPWTDGANWLQYSPSARVLVRDGEFVKLDRRTARALQRGLALPRR
jgi:hypothetical protein